MGGRFFGKYRGKVVDNQDPLKRGSVEGGVPAVLGEKASGRCRACPMRARTSASSRSPGRRGGVGRVRGRRLDFPIWTGCFWAEGEIDSADADPGVFFFRTPAGFIRIEGIRRHDRDRDHGGARIMLYGHRNHSRGDDDQADRRRQRDRARRGGLRRHERRAEGDVMSMPFSVLPRASGRRRHRRPPPR